MKDKMIRICAMFSVVLTVVVCVSMFYFSENHAQIVQAREQRAREKEQQEDFLSSMDGLELLNYYTELLQENEKADEFSQQIRIELPTGVGENEVQIEDRYISKEIIIKIPTSEQDYFYEHPMVGKTTNISDMNLESGGSYASIELTMDDVFELQTTYEAGYLYVDFVKPKDLYEKIIVVDAGHGGNDPGAVGGQTYEKDIDLAMLLELKKLFDAQEDIKVYYTRTEDANPSLSQRVTLANDVGADYFISIHNNTLSYKSAEYVNGTEVMYNETAVDSRSQALAQLCLDEECAATGSQSQGLEEGSSIYIIRSSVAPVALVEVGFMSNGAELQKLQDATYQQQAAQGIYNAIFKAYESGL